MREGGERHYNGPLYTENTYLLLENFDPTTFCLSLEKLSVSAPCHWSHQPMKRRGLYLSSASSEIHHQLPHGQVTQQEGR